jgi:hypothetical protein
LLFHGREASPIVLPRREGPGKAGELVKSAAYPKHVPDAMFPGPSIRESLISMRLTQLQPSLT